MPGPAPYRFRPSVAGVVGLLLAVWLGSGMQNSPARAAEPTHERIAEIGRRLVAAYPDHLTGVEDGMLVWTDGTRMPIDDGRGKKDFQTLLNEADLEDQFYAPYVKGRPTSQPGENMDPGRVRHEPFFRKMYGDCEHPRFLAETMDDVVWLPKRVGTTIRISKMNGIARQLQKVSNDLDKLDAKFLSYLTPIAGTLACRTIAGTNRRSMHGYAAAIDISIKHAHYWLWSNPDASHKPVYRNEIPFEIVEIFERHGFIWGGKWYHYDTMHFEYRPELLAE